MLLRAYGPRTDIFADHDMEARTHALLTQYELASPLLALFENGLLYQSIPGRVCTAKDLGEEMIWRAVAAKLAEWHALLPLHNKRERNIWTVLQHWVDALPTDTMNATATKISLRNEFHRSLAELRLLYGGGASNVSLRMYSFSSLVEAHSF